MMLDGIDEKLRRLLRKFQQEDINMELILANWEYILIGILAIDKVVALSPTEWDDLIWTSIKKAIFKAVGK